MTETNSTDDIRLKDVILKLISIKNLIWRKKILVICFSLFFGVLGVLYSFFSKEVYNAHLTFVVDESQDSGGSLGAISGMASQFGFNLGGAADGTFSQTNIQELITSRRVVEEALLTKGKIDGKDDLLINHHIEFNEYRKDWKNTPIENIYFTSDRSSFTLQHDSILGLAYNSLTDGNITTNIGEESNIFKISCQSKNEDFAKVMLESLVDKLEDYYIMFQTAKSNNTLDFLSQRADSILNELRAAEFAYADYKDANFGVQRAKGLLQEIRLKRDVEILNIMYGEVVKNLELSKFTLLNNKPLLNIIDRPVFPLQVRKISLITSFILFSILGAFFVSIYLILSQLIRDEMS